MSDSQTIIGHDPPPTTTPTPTPTPSNLPQVQNTSNRLLAPLIAGITGGVFVLCLAAFLIFFLSRKRKLQQKRLSQDDEKEDPLRPIESDSSVTEMKKARMLRASQLYAPTSYQQPSVARREGLDPNAHPTTPKRPARPRDSQLSSNLVASRRASSVPSVAQTYEARRMAMPGSLTLDEQLNYIKEQQMILEQQEFEQLKQSQVAMPPSISHSHFYPLQKVQSRVSETTHTGSGISQGSYVSAVSSPEDAASRQLTAAALSISTMLAQEAAATPHNTEKMGPPVKSALHSTPNSPGGKSTPYDEYLRYVKKAQVRPSPSSSLYHMGRDSSSVSAESLSGNNQSSKTAQASQVIPIAYIPGVTSNFSQLVSPQSNSPRKQHFAASPTSPLSPSSQQEAQDYTRNPAAPALQISASQARKNWRTSSVYSTTPVTPNRPFSYSSSYKGEPTSPRAPSIAQSVESAAATARRISYPATLEPTTAARAAILTTPSSAVSSPMSPSLEYQRSERVDPRYLAREALELDTRPAELGTAHSGTGYAPSQGLSDSSEDDTIEEEDRGRQSRPSRTKDLKIPLEEQSASPPKDGTVGDMERYLQTAPYRAGSDEAADDDDDNVERPLSHFAYPVVYESSEDISFISR